MTDTTGRRWSDDLTAVQQLAELRAQMGSLVASMDEWRRDQRAAMEAMQQWLQRDIADLKRDLRDLTREMDGRFEGLDSLYTRRELFDPVRAVVFALVMLIAGGFISGLVAWFWQRAS